MAPGRPYRLAVRTPPFHGGGTGSIPVRVAIQKDAKFYTGEIIVEKSKAKTASRRVVPMPDNLKEWLQKYAKAKGKVWPHGHAYLYEVLQETATEAGVEWKQNALRHSFISYRVSESGDVNRTALEAGNSAAMIHSSYRALVTAGEAKRWFSMTPAEAENIIKLKTKKAA